MSLNTREINATAKIGYRYRLQSNDILHHPPGTEMTKKLLIAILLFLIGGYLVNRPESETVGSLIVIGTFLWATYFLIIRPVINLVKRIFKKEPEVDEPAACSAKHKSKASTGSTEMKENSSKQHVQKSSTYTKQKTKEEKMDYLVPQHKLLLISINKSLKDAEIYDAVRYAWKLNVERARAVDYVLAHHAGKVIGVFVATEWLPATDPAFSSFSVQADPARWGFVGHVAPSEILLIYFGKQIPDELRKKGASNPIRFLDNLKDTNGDNGEDDASELIDTQLPFEDVVGRVDSDGDFAAHGQLSTNGVADRGSPLFIKSKVWAASDGKRLTRINESSDELHAGDELTLGTRFERIKIEDGAKFDLCAELDIFTVDKTESLVVEQSARSHRIELGDISIRIDEIEVDDDGDHCVRYTVFTSKPTIAAVRFSGEKDDEMQGYFQEFSEPEESHDEYVAGISTGDLIRLELTTMKPLKSRLSVTETGTVTIEESNHDLLESVLEKEDELVEILEESLPKLNSAPSGFCGCTLVLDKNEDGDLRMIIKVGTDNPDDVRDFDSDTLVDEILDSDIEDAIDELFAHLDISSSDFEYVAQAYTVD